MKETNPPTDLTVQGNQGENVPAINKKVNVTAQHVSADTKKIIKALHTSVYNDAVGSSMNNQKEPVRGDLTAVSSTSPNVAVNQPENTVNEKKGYVPNGNPGEKDMKNTDEQVSKVVVSSIATSNDTPDTKSTVPTAGPNANAKPNKIVTDEKKVPVPNDPESKNAKISEKKTAYNPKQAPAAIDQGKQDEKPTAGPTLTVMKEQKKTTAKPTTAAEIEDRKVKEEFKVIAEELATKLQGINALDKDNANFEYDGVHVEVKDHQVEKEPKWLPRKEPTQKNSDSIINVKPHSNDITVTTYATEEPAWCCCGTVGASITATINNLIYAVLSCTIIYHNIDDGDEKINDDTQLIWCCVIVAILSSCMMILNLIVVCSSNSNRCYASAIGNIVSNNVFLLVDGILCLTVIHNYNQSEAQNNGNKSDHDNSDFQNFIKFLVVINAIMIPPAWINARVGILQFEVAAQLLKKEEAETKEQCENPSISN